uniref:Condensin-2 complex subunit H2 n=1 Tax=Callorhinchus milii TaxID=7868 RepID=A0A4W3IXR2_CALMI
MEDIESRFTHLLQPIRELTKNWEIDVAAQLGEYLEELDQICISFDDGKTTMNFAEAALLIQGSACIYSKKVEYLYSLVYQALDFISNKKRRQQPASIGAEGLDTDVSVADANREGGFLSLDDIQLPTRNTIDLRTDHTPNMVNVIPLTPMALVPPNDVEKKNNPLLSHRGEVLASRKDFRMNTCTPHTTGAFLLELTGLSPMSYLHSRALENTHLATAVQGDYPQEVHMETRGCEVAIPPLDLSNQGSPEGGAGFLPLAEGEEAEQSPERVMSHKAEGLRDGVPDSGGREVLDPWRSLDPFEATENKVLRKGKHYVIPARVPHTGNKRKRKCSVTLLEFGKWFSRAHYGGADFVKLKRTGLSHADLEVLHWKHMKERAAAQRIFRKRMSVLCGWVIDELENNQENAEEAIHHEQQRDDDDVDQDRPADEDYDLDDLEQEPGAEIDAPCFPAIGVHMCASTRVYVTELFIANSQQYAQETALSLRVRDWEEKIVPRMQQQEQRGGFDIHDYGDRIMAEFDSVGQRKWFGNIVAGKEAFEVCRYMLASLQLANDYTVDIWQEDGLYQAVDTMTLTLLSKQRAHDRFNTYRATTVSNN